MRRSAGATFVVAVLLAQLCLAGDCVDGVTPDCSDAAAQCGPGVDGATPSDATSPTDAASDTTASDTGTTNDSGTNADADSGADADDQ